MEFSELDETNFVTVAKIYSEGIDTGNSIFETNILSFQAWDKKYLSFGRIVILQNHNIIGWASLSKVSDRCVYSGQAEVSVYVSKASQGKGGVLSF